MRKHGFTLIEVLVTVTIMAILAAIGYESYNSYIIRARREDGIQSMRELEQKVEAYFAKNNNLPTATTTGFTSQDSKDGFYTIEYSIPSALYYLITATAKSGTSQANDEAICKKLFLYSTHNNITNVKGTNYYSSDCN